jgi:flagellar biogenesis protein FliO
LPDLPFRCISPPFEDRRNLPYSQEVFVASFCPRLVIVPLAWIAAAWGLAYFPTVSLAGPPRLLDDDNPNVSPAAFAEPELPRSISPRTKAEAPPGRTGPEARKPISSVSLWGTVIGLCFFISLFLAGRAWLSRHGPAGFRGLPVDAVELLGRRTIEPRVSIHLVRCGPKILVLGVGPDGVRALTEITDPVEVDFLAGACRRKDSDASSFARMFRRVETVAAPPPREDV